MESTKANPIAFFDDYISNEIELDLIEFYKNADELGDRIECIDKENHRIIVLDSGSEKTFSFESSLRGKLPHQVTISKLLIEQALSSIQKKAYNGLIDFLIKKIRILKQEPNTKKFKFLNSYLDEISGHALKFRIGSSDEQVFSFNLLPEGDVKKTLLLYSELFNKHVIDCSKEEFLRCFSGKKPKGGIKWLLLSKKKEVNKQDLLYFIDQLIEESHLDSSIVVNGYNQKIEGVFRKADGSSLGTIRNSKYLKTANPSHSNLIDEIIEKLR